MTSSAPPNSPSASKSGPVGSAASSPQSVLQRVQTLLHSNGTIAPLLVLIVTLVAFGIAAPRFGNVANVSLILQQTAIVGILAVGQTLVILTAGIDLSVGAILVLSSLVSAKLSVEAGLPAPVALLIGTAAACACGLLNGGLIAGLRLPPFIVTLGTLNIFLALSLFISEGKTVAGLDALLTWPGKTFAIGGARISYGVLLLVAVIVVTVVLLRRTAFGRHLFAIGGDPEVARLAGIPVRRRLVAVYAIAGLIYGIGAWIQMGRIDSASPLVGSSYNLDSVTAVVIGGTSLFGGRGSIIGSILGALIVSSFRNGLAIAGVDILWQNFSVGVLTIFAVALDQWIRKVKA